MLNSRTTATLMVGAAIASTFAACSAGSNSKGFGNNLDNRGAGGAGMSPGGASGIGGTTYNVGGEGTFNPGGAPEAGGSSGGGDGNCGVIQKPEEIIVLSPVALYIMQDISSSMVGLLGDPNSWPNSLAAVTAFVQDPTSAGLDGLRTSKIW